VEVGEQDEVGAEKGKLGLEWFLDLNQQVDGGCDIVR
jgi:hypothetical protein